MPNTNIHATHHRRSIRLKGYDYSQPGAYFVTMCTHQRVCLFGEIVNGEMLLNEYGEIVQNTWFDLIHHNHGIELGEFVVMPNHFHGIIITGAGSEPAPATTTTGPDYATTGPAPTQPLSEIVRQLKTFSAQRINEKRQTPDTPVWQRNYWENVIRSEQSP